MSQSQELELLEIGQPVKPTSTPTLFLAIVNWYEWNKARIRFWMFYAIALVSFAIWGYVENMHTVSPPYLAYAKLFGKSLDFLLVILIFPVLRNFLSYLRTTPVAEALPLDDALIIHTYTGYLIMICAVGHIAFHYADFEWEQRMTAVDIWRNAVGNLSGATGHIIALLMLVVLPTTMLNRRIRTVFGVRFDGYKVFLQVHKLWMPIYILLFLHSSTFWKFAAFVMLFLILEKSIQTKRVKRSVEIVGASMAGRDILCLQMKLSYTNKKLHYKAGQYLFLCCPDISDSEYHPFTLTSAPQEGFFSCHIRCRSDMDWTYALRQKLGFADTTDENQNVVVARNIAITEANRVDLAVPRLKVDGPYGSASEEVFDYATVLLVGAGIGVTPFVSILKSMNLSPTTGLVIHFYWICRDQAEFDSFKTV